MAAAAATASKAMKKIMQRVGTAERVAAKRKKLKDTRYFKAGKKQQSQDVRGQLSTAEADYQQAKQAVRDGWELGPLAPREDVGEWAGARGAIHEARFRSYATLTLAMRNERCAWAGGAYNLNLAVGDRVVLLDGPDKGKIGNITTVMPETAEVTVDGLNKSNMRIGPDIRGAEDPPAVNMEMSLPISAIRLVHPLTDPATGVTRDVIINQLEHRGLVFDRVSGKRSWSRVVPGLNVSIPWPAKAAQEKKDHAGDTLRIDVEARTFVPTLLRPPMPAQVIDELRGRYSRFRTRHEPEYLARLEAEARAKEDRRKLIESMRTPLQEFHRQERANKKKKGKPRLTVEMLERIGEVIARNRERSLNAAGISDAGVSSSTTTTTTTPAAAATSDPSSITAATKPAEDVPPSEPQSNPPPSV
ncbi:hypothetical protein MGN70_012412 [Eutypa lata]|nr:hypothetical protein MGN70_012412 [Eutypa lata]